MGSLTTYREIIKKLINEYAQFKPAYGDIEIEAIFDETNEHYEMIYTGWDRHWRVHGSVLP